MILRWYNAKLAARPILTQTITTAILFGTGDVLAQQAVERRGAKNHDFVRTARMTGYGGLVFGPVVTTWFRLLQARIAFPSKWGTIGARVAADQLVFSPTMLAVFLSTMAALEGQSARRRLESSYRSAILSNWMVWPFVQVANFAVVPLQHRVLFVNVFALGWNCYLSWLNSQGGKEVESAVKVD